MYKTLGQFALIWVWLLCTAISSSVRADEVVECEIVPTVQLYDVSGLSAEEIRASMLSIGPVDAAGKRRFAHAEWSIKWHWNTNDDGSVNLDTVAVKCEGTITLPHLRDAQSLPESLRIEWRLFVERLLAHESRHLSNVAIHAPRIVSRLRAAKSPVFPNRANKIAQRVVADIQAMDREYDRATSNGRSEGCWDISAMPS